MVYVSLMTQIALRMFGRLGWIRANLDIIQIQVAQWLGRVGFRTKGSLVRTPAGAHFVVALSIINHIYLA